MIDFKEKLKRTKGITCYYYNAVVDVLEYYDDIDKCLIRVHKGESYFVGNRGVQLEMMSDGTDKIVVDFEYLRPLK